MLSLASGVFGILLLYSTTINSGIGRGLTTFDQLTLFLAKEVTTEVVSPSVLEIANAVPNDMRQRIIERVPTNHPLFMEAAEHALANERYCQNVNDITAQELSWIMVGHWMQENNLCLGLPDRRCPVSSAGARGPMQFMPGTWSSWGRDGNGDRKISPESLADSVYAAAPFLCYLRGVTGSWDHAICNYYGDNVASCAYQRSVRRNIDIIKAVLVAEALSEKQLANSAQ